MSEALERLATRAGIAVHWQDYRGQQHAVGADTLRALLGALGYPADGDAAIRDSTARLEQDRRQLPAMPGGDAGGHCVLPGVAAGARLEVEDEKGRRWHAQARADPRGARIDLPALPGWYRLRGAGLDCPLAVAPAQCTGIADLCGDGARPWGIAVQLYSLAEPGDMGLASYAALARFAEGAARHGAAALAVSPTHAMFSADPARRSPYGPSSRLFLNALHVDPVAAAGETQVSEALRTLSGTAAADHLEAQPLLDWSAAGSLRLALLRALAPTLLADPGRAAAFEAFRRERGAALEAHARFEMLHGLLGGNGWQDWPAEFHDCEGEAVRRLATQHEAEVRFHALLQFLAHQQRAAAQRRACEAGMAIGLVADLAIGADPGGSHAWTRRGDMLPGVTVGAPPDQLAPEGQGWGIAAFSPTALRDSGGAAFLELLRACMDGSGGLRVDHVMGLQRLWLIPPGGGSADGAYVSYPLEVLLRLLRLESWRRRCLVVGEDLGTVDPALRERLHEAGALGMSVLWFERDHAGYTAPAHWRPRSVAMTSTHDLPTLAGWWEGRDLALRAAIRAPDPATRSAQLAGREAERVQLWDALRASGHAEGAPPASDDPHGRTRFVDAAVAHVGSAACALALVPLEDVLATPEAPNLPGTVDEHPNWRRRLPSPTLAELAREPVAARLQRLDRARGTR